MTDAEAADIFSKLSEAQRAVVRSRSSPTGEYAYGSKATLLVLERLGLATPWISNVSKWTPRGLELRAWAEKGR